MIDILLATFNGEKYIRVQLDSILSQTVSDYRILIRDDGSTDNTVQIIHEYANKYDNIHIITDENNTGSATANFLLLMKHVRADYIMFCDQDDFWMPNKIHVTLETMKAAEETYGGDTPLLVYTDYRPVDSKLQPIDMKQTNNIIYKHYHELNRLLIQNYVTGCTMMMNRRLCNIATVTYSQDILMHDWWVALCASAMGHIVYNDMVTMLYRQHQNQSVGAIDVKSFNYIIKKINNPSTKRMDKKCMRQAKFFLKKYKSCLSRNDFNIINKFANIEQHMKIIRVYILLKGRYLKSNFIRIIGQLVYV